MAMGNEIICPIVALVLYFFPMFPCFCPIVALMFALTLAHPILQTRNTLPHFVSDSELAHKEPTRGIGPKLGSC